MSSTIGTTGDPIIQVHKSVGEGARSAAVGMPTVNAVGMRAGHVVMLEDALGDTRKTLGELARVADIGASGAEALSGQDVESGRKFSGWDAPELERRGEPTGETRVV